MPTTWLTPYGDIWAEHFGAPPHWGQMGKALKPIHLLHGPEYILPRLRYYLHKTPAQYINLFKFASTLNAWDDPREEIVMGLAYGAEYE